MKFRIPGLKELANRLEEDEFIESDSAEEMNEAERLRMENKILKAQLKDAEMENKLLKKLRELRGGGH